tara:strand:+ start:139 stop:549 length:411 start_codon:yes stop_codon:yes gene_type:complete
MITRILFLLFATISLEADIKKIEAIIANKKVYLSVADTQSLRKKGLMGVKELEIDSGMIFLWPNASKKCMWMKDTLIDLSVAFITNDKKITEIKNLQAGNLESVCSSDRNVIAAIEMNKDWFKENKVFRGSAVRFL